MLTAYVQNAEISGLFQRLAALLLDMWEAACVGVCGLSGQLPGFSACKKSGKAAHS